MHTVILLHGALGSSENFARLRELLAPQVRVLMCDFPGHGRNEQAEFGIDAFVATLSELIERENPQAYTIFGYSMGGFVALKFAAGKPIGLQKVITLGTKFDWTPDSAAREVKMLDAQKIAEKVPAFAAYLRELHADWRSLLEKTAGMMLALGEERGLSDELLAKVEVPVMLYRGSEDNMVSSEETLWAAGKLPHSSFGLLEGVVHPLERIDPAMIAGFITSALAEQ